jgi:hypothetical protein
MAKKKRTGAAAKARRASLKGFAKFQSPVHSNGFKQDVLIDIHGGDVGIQGAATSTAAATIAGNAGKTYFKWAGQVYKATSRLVKGRVNWTAESDDRSAKVK